MGQAVGQQEGFGEGTVEGASVGDAEVGEILGKNVVGKRDGAGVVGLEVGRAVGSLVGLVVGIAVGVGIVPVNTTEAKFTVFILFPESVL